MAVTTTLTLPASDTNGGLTTYIALGGNGYSAPQSMFEVSVFSAATASGGINQIQVTFDARFQSIVTYVRMSGGSASTALEMDCALFPPLPRNQPRAQGFVNAVPVNGLFTTNDYVWNPPPLMGMGRIHGTVPNINGDDLTLQFYMYNFNINVLQQVPLSLILASLPRGSSTIPPGLG